MLNKTNILVIFILFTIGCVNLPETTAENVEESPTATIDIDATVMAMFEASNSNETVKKDPPADTQVNITSANTEQAVSVNTEATIEALRKELLGEIAVTPAAVAQTMPTSTTEPISTSAPTATLWIPTLQPTPTPLPVLTSPEFIMEFSGKWDSGRGLKTNCYDIKFSNTNPVPIKIYIEFTGMDDSGIYWLTRSRSFDYLASGDKVLIKECIGDTNATRLSEPKITGIGYAEFHSDTKINQIGINSQNYPDAEWYNFYDSANPYAGSITVKQSPDFTYKGVNGWDYTWLMTNNSSDTLLVKPCVKLLWKSFSEYSSQEQSTLKSITSKTANLESNVINVGYQCGIKLLKPSSGGTVQVRAHWLQGAAEIKVELHSILVAKIDVVYPSKVLSSIDTGEFVPTSSSP
jgi:hypothetical protein